ncbi:hypothetical protein GPJ56_006128 [Histomonas meleagridis]|uniref:uncharacterized protein n=1 Tax=Histomonas meleagridis TaxID=135588 RepID=UPI0035593D0B|nr:hypothetical protein GPJ56_006128 [Histomonas meleagridis]KAH0797057.1 hypothetical protein GO595_010950 [Histomonas meleagridis]
MVATYPDIWPDFWPSLLKLPQSLVFQFVSSFSKLGTENLEAFQRIILTMTIDGSESLIVQYALDAFHSNSEMAFSILLNMIGFINPLPIIQSDVMNIIFQGLYKPDTSRDCISIISMLIQQEISPDDVNRILSCINFSEVVSTAIADSPIDTLCDLGSLISTAGNRAPSDQIYQIAIDSFLAHPNPLVSESVLTLLSNYAEVSPPKAADLIPKAFLRLSHHFESETDLIEIDHFTSEILKLLVKCAKTNPEVFTQFLIQAFTPGANCSLYLYTSIFHVLTDLHRDFLNNTYPPEIIMSNIVPFGIQALVLCQPQISRDHYLALTSFIEFFIRRQQAIIGPELYQKVFDTLCYYCIFDMNDFENEKFVDLLNKFIDIRQFSTIAVSTEIIFSFIKSKNTSLYPISAKLLKYIPQNDRVVILKNVFECFTQIFSEVDNKQKFMLSFLQFLREYKSTNVEDSNVLIQFYQNIFGLVSTSDELLSVLIDSIYKSLGPFGFELFIECSKHANGMESISSVFKTSNLYYLSKEIPNDNNWIQLIMNDLIPKANAYIQQINEWYEASEEVKEAKSIIINLFEFSTSICNILNIETLTFLLNFIGTIITKLIQIPETISYIFAFICALPNNLFNDSNFIQNVLNLTFGVITCDLFDGRVPKWRLACEKIGALHRKVAQANAQELHKCLAQVMGNSDMIPKYFNEVLPLEPTSAAKIYGEFFQILNEMAHAQ